MPSSLFLELYRHTSRLRLYLYHATLTIQPKTLTTNKMSSHAPDSVHFSLAKALTSLHKPEAYPDCCVDVHTWHQDQKNVTRTKRTSPRLLQCLELHIHVCVYGAANTVLCVDAPQCNAYRRLCTTPSSGTCKLVAVAAGMLCTLSWARERGFENADIPLHVYGPPGLADYIRSGHMQANPFVYRMQHRHEKVVIAVILHQECERYCTAAIGRLAGCYHGDAVQQR